MRCAECGARTTEVTRFCPRCGAPEARSRKTAYFGGVSVAGLRAIDLKAAAYGSGNRLEVAFIGTHH
jgi:hypothetical protein